MKYDVFISYRREGGTHQADALESKLILKRKEYRGRVFLDREEIRGEDWKKKIDESIRESCNFVVIISKGCFPHKGEGTDYFLLEIDQALRMGKNVIPVYYDGMEYKDIKDYLAGIEGFHNRNHITFNNNNTDGSVDQIIKFLKTEKEVLRHRYKSLCTEKTAVREELMLLEGEKLELKCPVCANSYTEDLTYCHVCGYKFFDELEKSASEKSELLQERGRLKKHKEIWCNSRSDETVTELKLKLKETENRLRDAEKEREDIKNFSIKNEREQMEIEHRLRSQLQDSEAKRKELEEYQAELEKQLETLKNQATVSVIGQETLEIPVNDKVSFKMIRVEDGSMGTFYIGETQVTQELWQALMRNNPSRFEGQKNPVERVSWYDICGKDGKGTDPNCFLYRLKQKTGKNFRLPTEAEWEYAAKGGNKSKDYIYAGSDDIDKVAWYWKNSGDNYLKGSDNDWDWSKIEKNRCKTHPVKQLSPNELGLYDMSGNVWEWCEDLYNPSSSGRVLRGGSWFNGAGNCRVSIRLSQPPDDWDDGGGFRLVLPQ